MRILVTGGAGFIGSHLVDALVERGHKVVIVDNLYTGFKNNINPEAKFYQLSVCDQELTTVFEQEKPEVVCHQAAQTIVTRSTSEPMFDAEQNILGSLNIILNCLKFGINKVIYASSGGAVYGDPGYYPVDEEHPVRPLSPYGASKHTVEHYLQLYSSEYGLPYVVLRYANVYGPRQDPNSQYSAVIPRFIDRVSNGQPPIIFGDGEQTRDFTFVEDIVDGTLRLGVIPEAVGDAFNLASETETRVIDIASMVNEITDNHSGVEFVARRDWDKITRRRASIEKARKVLGYEPKANMKDGIKRAYDWIIENRAQIEASARF